MRKLAPSPLRPSANITAPTDNKHKTNTAANGAKWGGLAAAVQKSKTNGTVEQIFARTKTGREMLGFPIAPFLIRRPISRICTADHVTDVRTTILRAVATI